MTISVLETTRLRLRSVEAEDFEQLFAIIFNDAHVMKHLSGAPVTRERALTVFHDVFDHEGTGLKPGVLEERQTGEMLGYAGLMPCTALGEDDFELGFVLRRTAWGRGYASEIGLAQLEYGFRTTGKFRLLAQARSANEASAKALKKIGMNFVKEYERPERGLWSVFVREREA